jgi:hypothetical protein
MRRSLTALCALLVLVPLQGYVGATPPPYPPSVSDGTGPLDNAADLASALHYEELVREHDGGGYVVPLEFDAWPELDPGATPTRMHGEGDSGNYTGEYLAAESFRYALAKKELAKLHGQGPAVDFWQGQLEDAHAKLRETVDYYHLISTISKNWQPALDPKVNPDGSPADPDGWLDLGASGVPGEAGLLMRICTPEQVDPAKPWFDVRRNYAPDNPSLFGPLLWDDGKKYWCLAANSRDSYAGTWFGLATALDLAGDDPHVKATVAGDLLAMADYATKYLWTQPRPHGRISNPVTGNDLRGPISPMWAQVPLHQLGMLQVARHAAALTGDTVRSLKYEAMYAAESAAYIATGALVHEVVVDVTQPHNAYYKYQLNWAHFFNLIRLEDNPVRREAYELALAAQNATTDRHDNAFFEAQTYALTGDKERLAAAVRDHHLWLDYIAFHEAAARRGQTPFLHTPRCSITTDPGPDAPLDKRPLACVPKDENDIIITAPDGSETRTVFTPGTVTDLRALDPLPVGVRRLADFLWQKDPTIVGGDHNVPWRGPSIDFLVTYWMTRYFSEAAVPALQPLPVWPGPSFS